MNRLLPCLLIGMLAAAFGCGKKDEKPAAEAAQANKNAADQKVTVTLSCGSGGVELVNCEEGANAWAARTGHKVKVVSTPNSSTERLALYQQMLAAGSTDIDVYQIDVVWPALLANHYTDLKPLSKGAEAKHFEPIVANNTVNNKLVAMPWFTDAGILYYRKDLLEKYQKPVPSSWEELTAIAREIQDAERKAGNDKMWGFVWQGKAYEGLTCNALEWVASYGGGSIIGPDGSITIDNPGAVKALELAASWIDTISPKGILSYEEEDARGIFQSGNAVFMRNWPYAWSLTQNDDSPVKGKVGVSALPQGSGPEARRAATLGGWQLAVSKYSKHPDIAADLVLYLTSPEEQKRRAIKGSFLPTIAELYRDEEILAVNPFMGALYDTFINAVPRPATATGTKYNRVSNEFWDAVHAVLSGKQKAADSLKALATKLDEISRGGQW